jgi:hypothetical protein
LKDVNGLLRFSFSFFLGQKTNKANAIALQRKERERGLTEGRWGRGFITFGKRKAILKIEN